ncbi:glucose-6-phosphate isomerase [Rhizocola hellebori]|uniref:Glucose-6-phosphate isomerase n=1 Tax=Rhizocola hellebori TaxID=1392758 RepID=A0A8J3Q8K7_9ACTN|nr:glucose-6-phosphate isomerase [Rhizocola hellebori]GIH05075.1 glucose-6-phosphate isomerase [Rhizocola hellebori]
MSEVWSAAGLTVQVAEPAQEVYESLVAQDAPAKLAAKDPTLWGPDAQPEAAVRLGWVDTFERSRALIPQLAELRDELADLDHVVLAGMGGSSLAPEVITRTLGKALTVLDTTDPGQVRAALGDRLERTVVVVASKSGSTIETDSHRRAYWQAFLDAGLTPAEAGRHFVVVTDPGSPLSAVAQEMGAFVILADPDVGGRYSALTAFGLVPSALAGVDIAELIDQAAEFAPSIGQAEENPALALGAALSRAHYAALADDGSGLTGLGDWAEQLIAESTGKESKGLLPVVIETPTSPIAKTDHTAIVTMGGSLYAKTIPGSGVQPDISVNGPLGAQFLCWEAATAFAGKALSINPFDQPNVTESKENTARILESGLPSAEPDFVDGAVIGYGVGGSLEAAIRLLFTDQGYVAIMAYLDRFADAEIATLRELVATESGLPTTFGWAPRFLHSTGQFHKGGPQVGAFLQITGTPAEDLAVPGKPYTFGQLQAAQAAGDRLALASRQRPLLHLHLTDRNAGIKQLLGALKSS